MYCLYNYRLYSIIGQGSYDTSQQVWDEHDLYTNKVPIYISLHDSWLLSRTELVLRATTSTPDSSLGRMCLYPLQYRVESHAGWPSLGSEAGAM